jgi:hypothetical protein
MSAPARGIETYRLAATFGSSPRVTNSPVPRPNPPEGECQQCTLRRGGRGEGRAVRPRSRGHRPENTRGRSKRPGQHSHACREHPVGAPPRVAVSGLPLVSDKHQPHLPRRLRQAVAQDDCSVAGPGVSGWLLLLSSAVSKWKPDSERRDASKFVKGALRDRRRRSAATRWKGHSVGGLLGGVPGNRTQRATGPTPRGGVVRVTPGSQKSIRADLQGIDVFSTIESLPGAR